MSNDISAALAAALENADDLTAGIMGGTLTTPVVHMPDVSGEPDLTPPAFLQRQPIVIEAPVERAAEVGERTIAEVVAAQVDNTPQAKPLTRADVAAMPTPVAPPTSNQPVADPKGDFVKRVGELGRAEGAGVNARPSFMLEIAQAAHKGAIVEDDAEPLYLTYQKAQAKTKGLVEPKVGSLPQQVSKVRTMIKMGALTSLNDPPNVLHRTGNMIKYLGKTDVKITKSAVDCFLTVARAQLQSPDSPLTDEAIKACIMPKEAEDKLEVDKLADVLGKLDKLYNTDGITDDTATMLEGQMGDVQKRIDTLGGTSKQKEAIRKAEEKAAREEAKAAKAKAQVVALKRW